MGDSAFTTSLALKSLRPCVDFTGDKAVPLRRFESWSHERDVNSSSALELHDDDDDDDEDSPNPEEGDDDGGDREGGGEGAGEKDDDMGEVVTDDEEEEEVTVVWASPKQLGVPPLPLQVVVVVVLPHPPTRLLLSSLIDVRAGCKMMGVLEVCKVGGRRPEVG